MADYSSILAAIDAAIVANIDTPGQIRSADGRLISYRSLDELRGLRQYYAKLHTGSAGAFNLRKIQSGSARV